MRAPIFVVPGSDLRWPTHSAQFRPESWRAAERNRQAQIRRHALPARQHLTPAGCSRLAPEAPGCRVAASTAITRSTRYIEYGEGDFKVCGFEAQADALLVSANQVISSAEAMCLNDEPNWSRKPLYQLRSMAQTRAMAKALRNVLAWVVVLANYQPTPVEEMDGVAGSNGFVEAPRRKSTGKANGPSPLTEDLNAAFPLDGRR